jgi:hypothetical protein
VRPAATRHLVADFAAGSGIGDVTSYRPLSGLGFRMCLTTPQAGFGNTIIALDANNTISLKSCAESKLGLR